MMGSERGVDESQGQGSSAGEQPTTVRGVSFWQSVRASGTSELNSHDDLAVDSERASWTVTPLTGAEAEPPVESDSRQVRWFLGQVIAKKERVARSGRAHRPLVKPTPKRVRARPKHAPVPCPLCRPGADADHPGEAWPDCELCDGEGVVTTRRAAEWHEEHD
jgi:hypothetical protein